ncbi:peptide/nickel transport system ATP-binding protein [Caldanaerobacter subterraneus subsp. tengcongensis MB4]|uniref:ABC-type dipeptide/oligopeptide/nickel transport system, ATPase component n=1 Tax=Caldanaerobacter subterraneus subsp. tengcongensis (strain DSM 15242 / JCM 11007 / NBRC 100824 / MB4) TaxID=273068 RepID=Q8RD22_CALS4|nr:ABC transporter ATP-binding protein [Caldanaerobacter subterraneus]AAM23526.1 ABC-type dipeptide/oligopeptide/nickel transport system, ATPase component [Caldanaerobacter subterraneus subsp. tengcongensis MB4]MCS3916993.1 peptide/nickel transport system ATP-binding protein [Caldanaerobacter subterraneus subsp. tengcongensis MB4]
MEELVIELNNIKKFYRKRNRVVKVINDISLKFKDDEILCLVGESGSGKTTLGKIIAGLIEPTEGEIRYNGKLLSQLKGKETKEIRRAIQMIHQDPFASLNPVRSVYQTLSTPLIYYKLAKDENDAKKRVLELLEVVDLTPPEDFIYKYPHQLSGGQRQRVAIARALTVNPKFIVADEPVSMVDASIKASIINTLKRIRREFKVGFLFITHDLALARLFGGDGKLGVMYTGRIVEYGLTDDIIENPKHPYTITLLSAVPEPDPVVTRSKKRIKLRSDDIPRLDNLPEGCHFHPRCPVFVEGKCDKELPKLEADGLNHYVACFTKDAREKMLGE